MKEKQMRKRVIQPKIVNACIIVSALTTCWQLFTIDLFIIISVYLDLFQAKNIYK